MGISSKTLPKHIWIILPAFNEERYLTTVLRELKKITAHIIVVDDGSSDATSKIAKKHTPHVVTHRVNLGKGSALLTGCEYAFTKTAASIVVFMDSDNQHKVAELPLLVSLVSKDNPVVLGSRSVDASMPFLRRIGNKSISVWIYLLYGVWVADVLSGFRAVHKNALPSISWNSTRYGVEAEMIARILKRRVKFSVVPITTVYHDYKRGMTLLDAVELYWQLLIWRILL